MNKSKFLILLIIGLLISNGILLFIVAKDQLMKAGPKNIIIKKLHFDKEQIKNYEVYIRQHRKAINKNETVMNTLRSNLYEELNYSDNNSKIDSIISNIAKQQITAEHINYNHFLEIKRLCKPTQQKDFNELTMEIVNLFSSKERK